MKNLTIGLVGNPNCGKSTIFNALTGARQRIGNWPGVTVEKKTGIFIEHGSEVSVVDLPGIYSLTAVSATAAMDERITCDFVASNQCDIIVNIVDASNLERNLYLTTQLLEMKIPMIVAVNMVDIARQRNLVLNLTLLAQQLGCPVVAVEGNKKKGFTQLKHTLLKVAKQPLPSTQTLPYPPAVQSAASLIATTIKEKVPEQTASAAWLAWRLLEDDVYANTLVKHQLTDLVQQQQKHLQHLLAEDVDIIIADTRYGFAHRITQLVVTKGVSAKHTVSMLIDKVVLNRVLGIPIFLVVMYLMFLFAINVGGAFQPFFDIASDTIFVQGLSQLLLSWHLPIWLTAIVASGIGKGINTTITFIPVIGAMFLFLSLLEDSGYMARAAFVMDRAMRAMGLPGKSFVPLIVGFGCNVPAIMATRTLENRRDRILTVMMSPFMSCGARLAIFAVFTAAFFPVGGQNVVFALYLIGILIAVLTGLILRKTILQGEPSPLIMELPPYHIPTLHTVLQQAWQRLKGFIFKAGRFIIPICILVGVLNSITSDGSLHIANTSQHSLLSELGRVLTPIFAPLGLHADNWPATVGLLTGVLAKEIVVATLNTLYTQVGHLALATDQFHFWAGIHAALISIPNNLAALGQAFSNPILASAPDHTVTQGVFGQMYQRFDGQIGAFAYLLFVLLYIPCVSTTAVTGRELGRGWMLFSIFWNTSLAYGIAVLFYQMATISRHPTSSLVWITAVLVFFVGIFIGLQRYANYFDKNIIKFHATASGEAAL